MSVELDRDLDTLFTQIDSVAGDTARWSQEESAEIYEALASYCNNMATAIRSELAGKA